MPSAYFRGRAVSGAPPSASPFSLSIPAIDNTYGAVLLGTFLGLILYGVIMIQVYWYVRRQFADTLYTKCYVAFIAVIGTLFTVQTIHMSYWYLVTNYFMPLRLFTGVWSINLLPTSTAVAVAACQCFFARRVYLVHKSFRPLVALVALLFMAELGCSIFSSYEAFILPSLLQFRNYAWTDTVGFALAVAADTIMTSVLVFYLHRSRTGFRRTNSTIDALIAYTVTTGLLIDLFSIISLVSAWVMPGNLIYAGCNIVSTHLYINCVLGTLNSRQSQSDQCGGSERGGLIHLPPLSKRGNTSTGSESTLTRPEKPLDVLHIRADGDHAPPQQQEFSQPEVQAVLSEMV